MEDIFTITEDAVLPSKGLVYDKPINPNLKLRSMTVAEELKRLSPSKNEYKNLCDIIEDCIVGEKPKIHVYDMCIGDYTYLLHKLRIATYGSEYKMMVYCSKCDSVTEAEVDLDSLKLNTYKENFKELMRITLPVTKKVVEFKLQTPRILDEARARVLEDKEDGKVESDKSLLYNLIYIIKSIDGERLDPLKLEYIISKLPMKDTQYLIQRAGKLNGAIGIDTDIKVECSKCKKDIETSFRYNSEFFRPTIDND